MKCLIFRLIEDIIFNSELPLIIISICLSLGMHTYQDFSMYCPVNKDQHQSGYIIISVFSSNVHTIIV